MEDVLALYHEPYDPPYPMVCFDETSKQLIKETRVPLPAKSGKVQRYDYEYERNGVRNLFLFFEPLAGVTLKPLNDEPKRIGASV